MGSKPRYLTKSRFKLGTECPTKLYFTGKPEYANTKKDNDFLRALAEGGFQVGELAKQYFPGGIEIDTLDSAKAISLTNEHLKKKDVILYEAALTFENLLVRVDILVKRDHRIELIEVKSKSFDPSTEEGFFSKSSLKKGSPKVSSDYEAYVLDIAYQGYVAHKALPGFEISHYLMLADKTAKASIDGLNQKFILKTNESGQTQVLINGGTSLDSLGAPVLIKIGVDEEVKAVKKLLFSDVRNFEEQIDYLAKMYAADRMADPMTGSQCKGCEFRADEAAKNSGLKSGFEECWKEAEKLSADDFKRAFVFEIWNFRKSQKLIEEKRFFIDQLSESDLDPKSGDEPGLSASERQWLQVEKALKKDSEDFLDSDGLAAEMKTWKYPLHFIDFETTTVAIPFHKGRKPYEQIAFQFSHHLVTQEGVIEHRDQYLHFERGVFPNFDFVRNLKKSLSSDEGTIFRYAPHENTVLLQIHSQLSSSKEADRDELMTWIESITEAGDRKGPRNMVDLCGLVKKYYYHPKMKGSNSIKKVLPAILATSTKLQDKYSKPVYGSSSGIISKNFEKWTWIKRSPEGTVLDPYKLLPPIFSDLDLETMDSLITDGSIADGGAAMTAYARMQFTQMTEGERDLVRNALLKYCELDTFAMVLIYEYWMSLLTPKNS